MQEYNEIQELFNKDIAEKKIIAHSSHYKGNRGKSIVRNQSDSLTKKEIDSMSSNVVTFKQKPINIIEFNQMDEMTRNAYFKWLINEFSPSFPMIADMLGVSVSTVKKRVGKDLGIHAIKGARSKYTEMKWNSFVNNKKEEQDIQTIQEQKNPIIYKPLSWEYFKGMGLDDQKQYAEWLVDEFHATATMIAEMFGKSQTYTHDYLRKKLEMTFPNFIPSRQQKERWYSFCGIKKIGPQYCIDDKNNMEIPEIPQKEHHSVSHFSFICDDCACFIATIDSIAKLLPDQKKISVEIKTLEA